MSSMRNGSKSTLRSLRLATPFQPVKKEIAVETRYLEHFNQGVSSDLARKTLTVPEGS